MIVALIFWIFRYFVTGYFRRTQVTTAKYSLRCKRSRTKPTNFGLREGVFRIRAARKMGREQISRGPKAKNSFPWPEFRSLRTGTLATQATAKYFCVCRLKSWTDNRFTVKGHSIAFNADLNSLQVEHSFALLTTQFWRPIWSTDNNLLYVVPFSGFAMLLICCL